MVSENPFPSFKRSGTANICNSIAKRIFSDVAGDITVDVDGQSFLLHKFPLVSRSGKIRKMVADSRDTDLSMLELLNVPGGPQTFELAAKFCYGTNFEITTVNVAPLRCAAEYLEMTEDYREENLIARTETYLNEIVMPSLEKSVEVLSTCESLLPIADEVGILDRCVDAIAMNASKEQLVSGLSRLECNGGSGKLKTDFGEWWVEDLSVLRIDLYQRVITAMRKTGVRSDSITASLIHFAQSSLKGIGKRQAWEPARMKTNAGMDVENEQRVVLEILVSLLPIEKSVPLTFLFGMLKMAIVLDTSVACRLELERRIGLQLEMVSLDDLLIPSLQSGDSLFDVDTVHRILVNFLQRIEEEEPEESSQYGYESEGLESPSHASVLKVGRLIDGYLAEIAPDPYLKLQKFMAIIELLPDYARVVDDGLYRAVDIYLKAHPSMTELECKKLCKLIDCQKLSQEASSHAAQNERLPVQMAIRILYFEQLRLKNALGGSSGDGFLSQRMSSGVPSAAMSPRDNYASLRRENRELKLEISRMRVRLSELEKEQVFMKQGMMGKPGEGKTFLSSLSRGFGIFGRPVAGKRPKCTRKGQGSEGKSGRRRRHSTS
ncbi:BTB/POZ domain-containing protein At3g08570 isoform X1 [Magnolia sinica]|uniref:BTB/POZ domain-containing protein At3g08570 isoform X1 n=2 Tax=Magnolia sinica TaxID=86752 RepID=UPI00265B6CDD|nr:BTB/POZ domain-containing protein At3g08570 isoform X1 [Magnolia sinica]